MFFIKKEKQFAKRQQKLVARKRVWGKKKKSWLTQTLGCIFTNKNRKREKRSIELHSFKSGTG